MKSNHWKPALVGIAGLIWLTILIQSGVIFSSPPNTDAALGEPQPTPTTLVTMTAPLKAASTQPVKSNSSPPPGPAASPTATATVAAVYHEVQPGEVPGLIAAEYGIEVEALLEINQISDPTTLQIGQQLRIPVIPSPPSQPGPATPLPSPVPSPTPLNHIVQAGDTLLALAAQYDTSVEAIMIANEISDPRGLQIGQELLIPPDKGSILGVPTTIHEIAGGDTLLGLAARYGSTLDDILATNPDLEPTSLQIGQKLVIPLTQPDAKLAARPSLPRITTPAEPSGQLSALEQATFDAVNTQRQLQGMPPLALDEQLTGPARAHAQDMVSRGYFSHVTPEGLTLRDRLAANGLDLNWVGENIQRNVQAPEQAAGYAVEWFMGSRPHRNNILHEHFNRVGIGVAEGPPGWYTFVLNFAGD